VDISSMITSSSSSGQLGCYDDDVVHSSWLTTVKV
jgi:hypothetical protein